MTSELDVLVGNTFLAAASISYYGPFTGNFREKMVQVWKDQAYYYKIHQSDNYTLVSILGNPVDIRDWQQKGLSGDSTSTNNALLIQHQIHYPLIIDP
jgi:dynein heavy chain